MILSRRPSDLAKGGQISLFTMAPPLPRVFPTTATSLQVNRGGGGRAQTKNDLKYTTRCIHVAFKNQQKLTTAGRAEHWGMTVSIFDNALPPSPAPVSLVSRPFPISVPFPSVCLLWSASRCLFFLPGTIKDAVTRYAHQSGHYVSRRAGWDCHGLPVEYEIDQTLGIKHRDQVCVCGSGGREGRYWRRVRRIPAHH